MQTFSSSTHEGAEANGIRWLLFVAGIVVLTQSATAAGMKPIDLKSCAPFAILASTTTTSTGGGTVYGNVGLYPAGSQGILPTQVEGLLHNGDPVAGQARLDLSEAIISASPAQLPGGIDVGDGELGGRNLVPGIYQSASGAYDIALADLTLTGGSNDVWVFQMASTLTVNVGRKVILSGGAQTQNVFWQVGSSATLDVSSEVKGTVMAYASITMNTRARLDGRALAQTGAVTFNGLYVRLSTPEAPVFTDIFRTNSACATVVLRTTPYYLLTLQACPDLLSTNWMTITTDTPIASPWKYTDTTATEAVPQRFYRAVITP